MLTGEGRLNLGGASLIRPSRRSRHPTSAGAHGGERNQQQRTTSPPTEPFPLGARLSLADGQEGRRRQEEPRNSNVAVSFCRRRHHPMAESGSDSLRQVVSNPSDQRLQGRFDVLGWR
jgi:hypothetical protein